MVVGLGISIGTSPGLGISSQQRGPFIVDHWIRTLRAPAIELGGKKEYAETNKEYKSTQVDDDFE